jgi:GT2 family glycosyltransferase
MEEPRITVLIINRNRNEETQRAAESIRNQTYKNIEIVIHDNSDLNMGVALPSNIAAKKSMAKYIFFLDNDAYLTNPDYIRNFVHILEVVPTCAYVFGRVLNPDGTDQWIEIFGIHDYDIWQECKSFNGNGVLMRRDLFVELGGYEQKFFAYYLEPEFATRIWQKGYTGVYWPDTLVHEQTPKSRDSQFVAYLLVRNGYWFHLKYTKGFAKVVKLVRRFGWAMLNCTPKTFVKAHVDMLRGLPGWI